MTKLRKNRRIITSDEYDKLVLLPRSNHVIVKITKPNKEYNINGIYMYGDSDGTLALQYYAQRYGIVDKVPSGLYFSESTKDNVMKWDTDMDVRVGDEVWFKINAVIYDLFEVDGYDYIVLHYRELIMARRDKEVICLNGCFLYKKLYEGKQNDFDVRLSPREVAHTGEVTHVGKRNRRYTDARSTGRENFDLNVGDKFLTVLPAQGKLEEPNFAHFDTENEYYYLQRRFIEYVY